MKKYLILISLTFQNYFVYRLSFVLWRFRSLIFYSSLIFFWLAVYSSGNSVPGYEKSKMLTYVILAAFLRSFVLGSIAGDLAGAIRSGDLNKIVLRPVNLFKYYFARDIPDKIMNVLFAGIELAIVIKLFGIQFRIPFSFPVFMSFGVSVLIALLLSFFISMTLSMVSFWTEEVWATRWLFGIVLLEFFSGLIFPLNVMPEWFQKLVNFMPFPYLIYKPVEIWLNEFNLFATFKSILIGLSWLFIFQQLSRILFKKGMRNYGAYGG